jgi:putative ABC transport system substrate-binding protein
MLSVALGFLFFFISPVHAEPLRVTVVLSEEGGVYQEFSDLLRVKMPVAKFALNTVNLKQTLVTADLYIAVGMKAADELASRDIPVLSVLVPKAGYDKLARSASRYSSAIYLDQPVERQLSLLVYALPKARHVGILYSESPPGIANLRHAAAENNLQLQEQIVGQGERSLTDALDEVLGESDVLLVLPDQNVYNSGTIRNILLASYRKQVPLIGISQSYVKAGALCAIYSTPIQIATQAAEIIRQFSDTGKMQPSQYPKEFEVSVNKQVARSLDLMIKDADQLRDEIRRAP